MHAHHLEFKIDQIRKDKMIIAIESIAIFICALFITVYLPQLLYQFYFANQDLTAEPPMMKFIPVVSFVVAVGYFLYATVTLVMKKMKLMQLEKELSLMMTEGDCCGGDCCGDDAGHDHAHHSDWMNADSEMEEKVMPASASKKKSPAKKKVAKKA